MIDTSKLEKVRDYVISRCAESPGGIARIIQADIGKAVGISRQAAEKHLTRLIIAGIIDMRWQSHYSVGREIPRSATPNSVPVAPGASIVFQLNFNSDSIEFQLKPGEKLEIPLKQAESGGVALGLHKGCIEVANAAQRQPDENLATPLQLDESGGGAKRLHWGCIKVALRLH